MKGRIEKLWDGSPKYENRRKPDVNVNIRVQGDSMHKASMQEKSSKFVYIAVDIGILPC